MRIAFVNTLCKIASKNQKIMLITGDLGFSVFEDFIYKLPKQYLNAGVAEQNMTGIAAGMAMEGKTPFIYSIVPFVTMRNFEQIRNDVCFQGLNVKIVGVGSGYSYGINSYTHYGLEDVGILRTLPGITILSPGDPIETELATIAASKVKGPVYLRLGKAGEPKVYKKYPKFEIGKGIILRDGRDIALITSGTMLPIAVQVADMLKDKLSVKLISMHTIKPLDITLIKKISNQVKAIFTLEEHTIIGGLGSAIGEVLSEQGKGIIFKRFASPDRFNKIVGNQQFMRAQTGLSTDHIVKKIKEIMK